jgi:hypothetical protein
VPVPESRGRKKATYTPPPTTSTGRKQSPPWFAPVMVALFVVGLAYIVIYYVSQGKYPIPPLDSWNIVIGFGIIMAGFGMSTRWK